MTRRTRIISGNTVFFKYLYKITVFEHFELLL